jgi:transposase
MFSYVDLEARVPKDHPLRPMREMVDRALESMSSDFESLYASTGRPSIPPERLLRAYPNTPSVVMHAPSARSLRCKILE